MALESLSPSVLVSLRFTVSGAILLGFALAVKAPLPKGRELLLTALFGVMILGIGNGCLAFAELWIPSSLAAMFITTSPFWMVGMEALLPGGDRLRGRTIAGMLVGFAGTLLLVARGAFSHSPGEASSGLVLRGFLVLQLAGCAWAVGSIAHRRQVTRAHPVVSGGVQQLAAGLSFVVPALVLQRGPVHLSARSLGAVAYLVLFGSIVGYSAYIYALDKLPVSVLSLYNYINPIVAVCLGWLIYREPAGWRELLALAIILVGVAIVKSSAGRRERSFVTEATPLKAEAKV